MSVAFQQSTKDGTRSRKWKNAEKKIFEGNKSAIALCSLRRYAKVWGLPWGGRDLPPRERPQTTAYRCKPQSSRWVVFTTTRNNRKHHSIATIIVDVVSQRRTGSWQAAVIFCGELFSIEVRWDGEGDERWDENEMKRTFLQTTSVSRSQRSGLWSGGAALCSVEEGDLMEVLRSHICCDGIS